MNDFRKCFLVAYATTIKSAQGMSVGEPYTIHVKEWDRMEYTALSRSCDIENIHTMIINEIKTLIIIIFSLLCNEIKWILKTKT